MAARWPGHLTPRRIQKVDACGFALYPGAARVRFAVTLEQRSACVRIVLVAIPALAARGIEANNQSGREIESPDAADLAAKVSPVRVAAWISIEVKSERRLLEVAKVRMP